MHHFIKGLNAHISGGVRVFKSKTMEVDVENVDMALGGHTGVQLGDAPLVGFRSQGGQSLAIGSSKGIQAPTKGEQQQQHSQSRPKNSQAQHGSRFQKRKD